MAFTPLSAKFAKVRVGANVVTAKKWQVNPKCDKLEITNFEGLGYADWIAGIIELEFTIDADWDSAADPFANPPNIVVSAILSTVKLYTNDIGSAFWSIPLCLVTDTPNTADVRQTVSLSFTAAAKGSFTYP